MSVEIDVTITAKQPPSMDFSVEMPVPCPTEPTAQMEWTERLERRVQEKLSEIDSYGNGYDGYMAEYINEYAGGYDIEVREGPSYGPSFLTPEDIQEANQL